MKYSVDAADINEIPRAKEICLLADIASDGLDVGEEIVTIYENYCFDTEVIVASMRNPLTSGIPRSSARISRPYRTMSLSRL